MMANGNLMIYTSLSSKRFTEHLFAPLSPPFISNSDVMRSPIFTCVNHVGPLYVTLIVLSDLIVYIYQNE